ncbi:fibronectin type III domain-containing protein 11 [Falco peregrinus]|uniref:fibronectin type III domain-containing protein 11 n=1 Tax=Falco peregrinus TaxID=8954 RepID=UPI00247A112F|nr:fibronectin type III domain-containing protein 11 [Falco peregrinus]
MAKAMARQQGKGMAATMTMRPAVVSSASWASTNLTPDGFNTSEQRWGAPAIGFAHYLLSHTHLSFGIMAVILNEFETSLDSTAHSEAQDNASWEQYSERSSFVLQFLNSTLSLHHLQHHRKKVELLSKCYFYLDIEPKHVTVTEQNQVMHRTNILQLIDPRQFQRMKKVGKNQTEIQLSLLTELLEQLERGREELSHYVETYDTVTFLSRWDMIMQRLSKLSEYMETLTSLQVPGKLHVKHQMVSQADLRGTTLPNIRLSLRTKMPLIFDRNESFAHKDWATLKWFAEDQKSHLEQYELHVRLLTGGSQAEVGYGRIQVVISNTCVVRDLQPGSSYTFLIRRSNTQTLVFERWHDSITLTTQTDAVGEADRSAWTPKG